MKRSARKERGTAALEMVLVLFTGIVLLQGLVLFGRLTWHVTAMQKAVGSAARIVAARPVEELSGTMAALNTRTFGDVHVRTALESAGIDMLPGPSAIDVHCNGYSCYSPGISTVAVSAPLIFEDTVFTNGATARWITEPLLNIRIENTLAYVP